MACREEYQRRQFNAKVWDFSAYVVRVWIALMWSTHRRSVVEQLDGYVIGPSNPAEESHIIIYYSSSYFSSTLLFVFYSSQPTKPPIFKCLGSFEDISNIWRPRFIYIKVERHWPAKTLLSKWRPEEWLDTITTNPFSKASMLFYPPNPMFSRRGRQTDRWMASSIDMKPWALLSALSPLICYLWTDCWSSLQP